jgi:hypothetical protein
MRVSCLVPLFAAILVWPAFGRADDLGKAIRNAVERSTLDQRGTKPFHLRATLAPSFERDKDSGRTGEVEIWWASPTEWKREVRSPDFHQIAIMNGNREWQKSEGDYFPEWLQETAIELVKPVPPLDRVLEQAKQAEIRRIGPMTNLTWETPSGTAEVPNILRSWVALQNNTGLLLYAGGMGWGGEFKDYANFHGRMVARTINVGASQVTAKVTTLEDLGEVREGLFEVTASGGDSQPLQTVLIDETSLRKNLLPSEPVLWPPLRDRPLEGHVTTTVVIDREGKVREIGPLISDNPGVNEVAERATTAMRFTPFLAGGVPAQAMSQITIAFKTVRPVGVETFESARSYFERGRNVSFPAAGTGPGYVLHATFQAKASQGKVESGEYVDTWESVDEWRREASIAKSRYVRAQHGDKRYELSGGPDAPLLKLVLRAMEPIPAIDTFVESDWRIRRDTVLGVRTVRVLTGYESPDGIPDPEHTRAYWFDDAGRLVKTYFLGLETRRSNIENFDGAAIAQDIQVFHNGGLGMLIHVTDVSAMGAQSAGTFVVPGHEWHRAFTDEVR